MANNLYASSIANHQTDYNFDKAQSNNNFDFQFDLCITLTFIIYITFHC